MEDIINRLEDARTIANAQLACKDFQEAGNRVRSLRFVVLDRYHDWARDPDFRSSMKSGIRGETDGGESSSSQDMQHGISLLKFKDQMVQSLNNKLCLEQLHIEVESKLQAKAVLEDERRRTDFWISDPQF